MPSALRFRVPRQGQGIGGGVGQESGVEWSHVFNLAGAANGYAKWGRQWNLVSFSHDTEFLMKLRNLGSGGRHLDILKSTDGSRVLAVTDTGLTTALAITSTLATGTAPFTVASTTVVANLNASLLQGHPASDFALDADLDDYLPLSGGEIDGDLDITGDLSVNEDFDVDGDSALATVHVTPAGAGNTDAIFVRHNSARDYWSIGGTDSSNEALVFRDPSSTTRLLVASGPTYHVEVHDSLYVADHLEVDNDITVNADGSQFNGTVGFSGGVTVDTANITLSGVVINHDQGGTGGFTRDNWDGYTVCQHDGVTKYHPYTSSPPS
jgi:hypothetical protein